MVFRLWTVLVCCFVIAHLAYLTIYRLFLSPLSRIPGPVLAGLTSCYEIYYDVILPGQYVWKIKEMHRRHGPIVRIAPGELHIQDPEYLDEIYAGSSRNREKYAFQLRTLPLRLSMGAAKTHEVHRKRRDALNSFFSRRSVIELEPMIRSKIERLTRVFGRHRDSGTVVNLSSTYYALANDIVVRYSFSRDDDLLDNESKAATLRKNISDLLLGVKISQHFPWIFSMLNALPLFIAKNIMPPGALDMLAFVKKTRKEIFRVLKEHGKDANKGRSIFYDLRDNPSLPDTEKSTKRLEDEATLLVMAGTESVAVSIATSHFYLMHQPEYMIKVRNELAGVPLNASWTRLETLPYLTGAVLEGLRLSFGVTGRLARIAPDESLQYRQHTIPPGTPVSSTTLCIHTDETVFPDPLTFRPERWFGTEGMQRRRYLMSFNKGSRQCIGINLAYAEIYLALAAAARFDWELFETDESDVRFKHDFHAAFPKLDSQGVRARVKARDEAR
ncbi:MAG: hypothetical protein Q9160_004744 [Pyrenula sp. 1 TL-2023]